MFKLGYSIVSEDIVNNEFVCNLYSCKGQCCVDGEAGAPLESNETKILEDIYIKVRPFLRKEGIESIEKNGTWIKNDFHELETPLIKGAECAYVIFDEKNNAKCAIEKAYNLNKINWKKPISCHLYPIRIKSYNVFTAVNYHKWDICDMACLLGKKLKVPIYKFAKEALIRKFGVKWYNELEKNALNIIKK